MKNQNYRKPFILGMIATTTVTSLVSLANVTSISGFNIFNTGGVISSSQMNQNFELIYQNAQNLCGKTLNGKALDCNIVANDKDILSYDSTSETWKPRAVNGLNYLGSFDASLGTAPGVQPSGSYYIISAAGVISGINFEVGDWIVSNGSAYQKIDNSTTITNIFGRTGAVTANEGDYNLNLLSDVDLSTAPTSGQVLKFNGIQWVASTDNTSGAGSVTTTEILDGAITNADISSTAGISFSKLTIGIGEIPQDRINGLNASISAVIEDVITDAITNKAPSQNAVYDSLALKADRTNVAQTITAATVTGLTTPVSLSDATNKQYVDSAITSGINSQAIQAPLAGFTIGPVAAVTSADTILVGMGKLQGQISDVLTGNAGNQWIQSGGNIYRTAGSVGIGTNAPVMPLEVATAGNAGIAVTADGGKSVSKFASFSPGTVDAATIQLQRASGSKGAPTPVSAANKIGQISFSGHNGSTFTDGATIEAHSMSAFTGVSAETYLKFTTTPNGSSVPTERMRINSDGKVGIGTNAPAYELHVLGQVAGTSAFMNASDKRLKENIHTVQNALDKIHLLRGVSYHFTKESQEKLKNSNREELGVIAQEVKKVFPQAVTKDSNGFYSVAYSMLISPLIEAVKELDNKVSMENKALKEENAAIKSYLCEKDPHAPFCSN